MNRLLHGLAMAALPAATLAADAPVPVPVPSDFGVRRTGLSERVVYAHNVGTLRNPVDRQAIEAQCASARHAGLTREHPRFEPGHDHALTTQAWRFGNPHRSVDFTALHAYECDRAPTRADSARSLCGCTYRVRVQRHVNIRTTAHGQVEELQIDLTTATLRRQVIADRSIADADRDAAHVRALAPEVVGRDAVAGIPCVWRRQRLASDGWIDRCIAEDNARVLPAALRFRSLAERMASDNGQAIHNESKAVAIVIDASVDSGVFELPDTVAGKEPPR